MSDQKLFTTLNALVLQTRRKINYFVTLYWDTLFFMAIDSGKARKVQEVLFRGRFYESSSVHYLASPCSLRRGSGEIVE